MEPNYTDKQGQYLAFNHHYSKVHGYANAESDTKKYSKVAPSSVHQMVVTLEKGGRYLDDRAPYKFCYAWKNYRL